MQRKTRRIIAAVAVIALLAAGGAAFTASITGLNGGNANIGFGSETVTGAAATGVNYSLSADGQYVDNVAVTLTGDFTTGYTFNGRLTGAAGALEQIGTCTPATPYSAPSTTLNCDFTGSTGSGSGYQAAGGGAANTGVAVTSVTGFELSVTDNGTNGSGNSEGYNGS